MLNMHVCPQCRYFKQPCVLEHLTSQWLLTKGNCIHVILYFSKTTSAGAIMHSAMNGQPEPGLGMGRGGPAAPQANMRMDGPHAPPQQPAPPVRYMHLSVH